jgi:maltoporin
MSWLGCVVFSLLWVSPAAAQQADQLEQQLKELKQEYEATTQALQLRMATLEQQIESQKEAAEKTKAATVSAADLAAERAAKAVLSNPDQVGAKFQGDLPSEPTYDLLREADETIAKLKQQVGTFEFHGYFRSGYGLDSAGANRSRSRRRGPTRNTVWATKPKPMGSSSLSITG